MAPQTRLTVGTALLVLALAAAGLPGAAARRGLVQDAAAAGADEARAPAAEAPAAEAGSPAIEALDGHQSIYGSPQVDFCIELTNKAGQACTVESDTLSLVYSRASEQLPTPEQIATAINNMKAAAQPSASCCKDLMPYADARCPCDPGYQQLLPVGGFDPAYFEGATAILVQACGYDFPPCKPGEAIKTGG